MCLVSMCAVIHQARCVLGVYVCSHPSGYMCAWCLCVQSSCQCVQSSIGPDVCLVSMCAFNHQARFGLVSNVCNNPLG